MHNINISFKKIYSLLILSFVICLMLINTIYSAEKIGTIANLTNEVHAVNADGETRLLDLYDEVFLQDKILTNELSTATVQYNDSSTIIIKESSSFKVTSFNITGLKDIFLGKVERGSVIIESGKIAKKNDGSMIIELPKMSLEVKGTRFNIKNNQNGTYNVSLAKDSFGKIGTINISSENEVKTLYNTDQVVFVNIENGILERPKTDDEKKVLTDVSNDLVNASVIDENEIQNKLEEKLIKGTLLDANGDGIIDSSDIEVIKNDINTEKQEKLDFIVENSSEKNTKFLSDVLNSSDQKNIGQSLEKILEKNDSLVSSIMINLSNKDNSFLTTTNIKSSNIIKEKIYTNMLNNSNDENNNTAILGKIITKANVDNISLIVSTIQKVGKVKPDSALALEVLSSVADLKATNETNLEDEKKDQVNRLIETAVTSAADIENNSTTSDQTNVGYDKNGFSLISPYYHKDTGTTYNSAGFNKNGYNNSGTEAAKDYDSAYAENVSPS